MHSMLQCSFPLASFLTMNISRALKLTLCTITFYFSHQSASMNAQLSHLGVVSSKNERRQSTKMCTELRSPEVSLLMGEVSPGAVFPVNHA